MSLQLFPSTSIDVGATNGVFLLFPNGFLLCDHGLDFLYGCENSTNQSWVERKVNGDAAVAAKNSVVD